MDRATIAHALASALLAITFISSAATQVLAITLGQVDDFQSGTTQNWSGASPNNVNNAGPGGAGDRALSATASGGGGSFSRLLIYNTEQWTGDWTSATIGQVTMDIRNPNASALTMRLAIAGPGGFSGGGFGDTYSTVGITVPADNQWHSIAFDVAPDDWQYVGQFDGTSIEQALAEVLMFRVVHNPNPSFIGEIIDASFFVDNITAAVGAVPPSGDYNQNGAVDAADYVLWRKTLNQSAVPAGSGADGDGSGTIDGGDYLFWRERFGNNVPGTGSGSAVNAIPEPTVLSLVAMAIISWVLRRSWRNRLSSAA